MERVVTVVVVAVVLALAWIAFTTFWLWRNQERVVFQPPTLAPEAPFPARRVEFMAGDGHPVFGYHVAPTAPGPSPRRVVIAFHGNADLAAWLVPWALELADRSGADVLLPEYRGYAGIPGSPSYTSAAADARGALDFVLTTLAPAQVILYGHSLGTAVAADLARHMNPRGPSALVLQAPFTSAREMAVRMLVPAVPWLWRRISRVHYDTRTVVAALDSPVWVAHGTRDVVIPVRMGRQVFAAARRPGALLIIEGAGHNDIVDVGGERYWKWLTDAVTRDSLLVTGKNHSENPESRVTSH